MKDKLIHVDKSRRPAPAPISVGHVHMKASNLEVIYDFYVEILGFSVTARMPEALFLSTHGYHHTLAFNTWTSKDGQMPTERHTGLYHIALLYESKKALADAVKRLKDNEYPIQGLSDHGTHLAIYLADPEGNGLELYWDKPVEEWPIDENGQLRFVNKYFDLNKLLNEA